MSRRGSSGSSANVAAPRHAARVDRRAQFSIPNSPRRRARGRTTAELEFGTQPPVGTNDFDLGTAPAYTHPAGCPTNSGGTLLACDPAHHPKFASKSKI